MKPRMLMLSTGARGGIRSVVEGYIGDGLLSRWNGRWIITHVEGGLFKRLWTALASGIGVLTALLAHDLRLIHVHAAMRGSFWRKSVFASLARAFGVKVILHLHGSEMVPFYEAQGRFGKRVIAHQLRAASEVFVLSRSWARFVKEIAPDSRIRVVPNYVRMPDVVPERQGGASDIRFLFLGLVGTRKGVYDLLPAFARVVERHSSARLVIGGNGELDQARQLCEKLGISRNVEFAGWVGGEEKNKLLKAADVYILPSHNEGLPMSILEAMACGLPVISTRVGGIPEVLHDGSNGLLVDAGNVDQIADAVFTMIDNAEDRLRMGRAAREFVEGTCSDKVVLPMIEDIYAGYCS